MPIHSAVHVPICVLHGVWPQEEAGKAGGAIPLLCPLGFRGALVIVGEGQNQNRTVHFQISFLLWHLQNRSQVLACRVVVGQHPECDRVIGPVGCKGLWPLERSALGECPAHTFLNDSGLFASSFISLSYV